MSFRIYEPQAAQSTTFPSAAVELETALRNDGHLVLNDPTRRGIWSFRIQEKHNTEERPGLDLGSTLNVGGYNLGLAEEGTFEPLSLQKGCSQALPSNNTPTSSSSNGSGVDSSQKNHGSPGQPPRSASHELDQKAVNSQGFDAKALPTSNKTAYENFIAAVLVSASTSFCPVTGAVPLNYRTVLLPSFDYEKPEDGKDGLAEQDAFLGTFTAYLTSMGALVISFKISLCRGLLSLDNIFAASFTSPGQTILAAPFGIQATNPTTALGEFGGTSLAQTPITQAVSFRGPPDAHESAWRQACLKALQHRGIPSSSLEGCPWVNITVPRRRLDAAKGDAKTSRDVSTTANISWPGPLCFRQRVLEASTTSRLGNSLLNGHEESHDPLGNAGRWLHSATEREDQISKRRADRSAPAPMEIDTDETRAPNPTDLLPAPSGRPSTAVVGAMYPTPPDGVQNINGITPTFDGTMASPQNPPSASVAADIEDPGTQITNPENNGWDRPASKGERSDSKELLTDPGNMILGADMFDDNDITEADFNFFDEEPGDIDLDMDDFVAPAMQSPQKNLIPKIEDTQPVQEASPAPLPLQDPGVFMKPELKHARSLLNDVRDSQVANDRTHAATSKRDPSPFNPETVFKRVRGSLGLVDDQQYQVPPLTRKTSVFEKVEFDPSLPLINKKYEQGGIFAFDQTQLNEQTGGTCSTSLPETNYLKRHRKRNRKAREFQAAHGALMRRFTALENAPAHPSSPAKIGGALSDDGRSSVESDEDDSSVNSDDALSPIKSSLKRTVIDDDAVSQVTSLREADPTEEPDQQLAIELPRLAKAELPEIQPSKLFLDPEPLNSQLPLGDEDVVSIAQLVTDQAATGRLDIVEAHKDDGYPTVARQKRQLLATSARDSLHVLQSLVPAALDGIRPLRLKGLLEVQDVPLLGQPARLQPRPVPGRDHNAEHLRPSNLYQIPCHHLEVRRAESKLSVLPTAIAFWESLGLAPASGSKNAHAVCVFPGWTGMMDNVRTYLERLKSLYELLRLGTFENLALSSELEAGLVPYEVDSISTSPDASVTGQGSTLIESMEVLQAAFSSVQTTETNFIIFMVYTPSNPRTVVEACLAYRRFIEMYWEPLAKKEHAQREIVMQLVSADLISSPSSLVVTPSSDLVKICIEIYDRCTLFGGPLPAPAIILEQALPRIIDFKLTNTPSASLIHENSCIHVAYAQSVDERWVSAAWTDDRGSQQAAASYCMGRKGRPLSRTMHEIANEIWETTLEIMSHRKVHWRIIITKSGTMERQEIEFWADLAKTESNANFAMVLMTVDTNPSLQLLPPAVHIPPSTAGFYTTPVSTPQASIVSPEQSHTPATPMRDSSGGAAAAATPGTEAANEAEADAALLDLTDQTWGAVVGHRLTNSSTPLELQPALASGYLIKRTGAKLEDPPVVMEVNLVHTESTARAHEPLLREMLSNFRGLGTLARARGVVEKEADVRPWHVAAAEKAVRALYMLM